MNKKGFYLAGSIALMLSLTGCSGGVKVDDALVASGTVYESVDGMTKVEADDVSKILSAYNEKYSKTKLSTISTKLTGDTDLSIGTDGASMNIALAIDDTIRFDADNKLLHQDIGGKASVFGFDVDLDTESYSTYENDVPVTYTWSKASFSIGEEEPEWEKTEGVEDTDMMNFASYLAPSTLNSKYVKDIYFNKDTKDYVIEIDSHILLDAAKEDLKLEDIEALQDFSESRETIYSTLDESLSESSIYMTLGDGVVLRGYYFDAKNVLDKSFEITKENTKKLAAEEKAEMDEKKVVDPETGIETIIEIDEEGNETITTNDPSTGETTVVTNYADGGTSTVTYPTPEEDESQIADSKMDVKNCFFKVEYISMNEKLDIVIPDEALAAVVKDNDLTFDDEEYEVDYDWDDEEPAIENTTYAAPEISLNGESFILPCKLSDFEKVGILPNDDIIVSSNWFEVVSLETDSGTFLTANVENLTNEDKVSSDCIVTGINYNAKDSIKNDEFSVFGLYIGMSEAEADALLGDAKDSYDFSGYIIKEYEHENCALSISFEDDKLVAIELYTY